MRVCSKLMHRIYSDDPRYIIDPAEIERLNLDGKPPKPSNCHRHADQAKSREKNEAFIDALKEHKKRLRHPSNSEVSEEKECTALIQKLVMTKEPGL